LCTVRLARCYDSLHSSGPPLPQMHGRRWWPTQQHGSARELPKDELHLDLRLPAYAMPQSATTTPGRLAVPGLVIELASLHRAAEVARFEREQRSDASSSADEATQWGRLLRDLYTHMHMVVVLADTTPSATTNSQLRAHVPQPSWARRYPGAVGEWLGAELEHRARQHTAEGSGARTPIEDLDASVWSQIVTAFTAAFAPDTAALPAATRDSAPRTRARRHIDRQVHAAPQWHSSGAECAFAQHMAFRGLDEALTAPGDESLPLASQPTVLPPPLVPIAAWADQHAVLRTLGFLSRGALGERRLLDCLAPRATALVTRDERAVELLWALCDASVAPPTPAAAADAGRPRHSVDRALRPRANALYDDATTWSTHTNDLLVLRLRGSLASDVDIDVPPLHADSQPLQLRPAADWLGADRTHTRDARLYRHIAHYELACARRLAAHAYTQSQLQLAKAASPAAVDELVSSRARTYLRELRALQWPSEPRHAQVFTLTHLSVHTPSWEDVQALNALVFVSHAPIHAGDLVPYDAMSAADVHRLAQCWHLCGPGFPGPPGTSASHRDTPPTLPPPGLLRPAAYLHGSLALWSDTHSHELCFVRPESPAGISGRYLALKVLPTPSTVATKCPEIQYIGAQGFSGPTTSSAAAYV